MPVVLLCLVLLTQVACSSSAPETTGGATTMPPSGITTLQTTDTKPGTGAEARAGMLVRVHYTGWLYDVNAADKKGPKFDSSRDRNDPFQFRLGSGEVIPGWDQGFAGMKVGGTRLLTVPPAMGYGPQGAPPVIPPEATLLFDVELLDVR